MIATTLITRKQKHIPSASRPVKDQACSTRALFHLIYFVAFIFPRAGWLQPTSGLYMDIFSL